MTEKKFSWLEVYAIKAIIILIVLLIGFSIAKRYNLFQYGDESYGTLILVSVFISIVTVLWDFISRRKRTKK